MEPITVVICTYDRIPLLERTIRSYETYLRHPGGFKYVIANDGGDEVARLIDEKFPELAGRCIIAGNDTGAPRGLGGNLNNAYRYVDTAIVLQSEDDYELVKMLNIEDHVAQLYSNPACGWIRLKALGGQRFHARTVGSYWEIDWHSPELYIASNQPHLKRWRDWHSMFGWYPMGQNIAWTENTWCEICDIYGRENPNALKVYARIDDQTESNFIHTGDELSWQARGL